MAERSAQSGRGSSRRAGARPRAGTCSSYHATGGGRTGCLCCAIFGGGSGGGSRAVIVASRTSPLSPLSTEPTPLLTSADTRQPHEMQGDRVVAQFRAGKLVRDGGKMTPDLRQGVLRVVAGADELTHFTWGARDSSEPEIDVIVFPEEAKLQPMPAPRCYALKFEGQTGRNLFFWVQEGEAEGDARRVSAVNVALGASDVAPQPQGPPHLVASTPAHAPAATAVEPTPAATSAPSSAPPAPSKAPSFALTPGSAARPSLGDLQSILSGMGMAQASSGGGAPSMTAQQAAAALAQAMTSSGGVAPPREGPLLSEVLTPEVLLSALGSEGVQARLAEYLPVEHRNASALRELVTSPQFSAQLQSFSRALQSGQVDLAQFGLAPGASFSVADFLLAIQSAAQQAPGGEDATMDDAPQPPPQ